MRTIKILTGMLALAAISSTAVAQSGDPTLQVRYFAGAGYGGEGMPYRDCSAPVAEDGEEAVVTEDTEAISTGPARRQDVASDEGNLTPEQARALRTERRGRTMEAVQQIDNLLATMPANNPNRPEYMFRKAELLKELADSDYLVERATFNECIGNWYNCTSDAECYEPMPDYVEAIGEYSNIARNFGQYQRIDEVIFRLGESLMENDDGANGVAYLGRLVANYPNSGYIADAHLLMADYYFEEDVLDTARSEYMAVLNFPDASIYNYAIYKLGWVDINQDYFPEALDRFQTVVRNLDSNPSDTLDFRRQALNDMLLAYVDIEGGWQAAREYYENLEGEEFMRGKLSSLANLFDERGMDDSRLAVVNYFIERYPSDPSVPQWMADALDSLDKIGVWDRYEENARRYIAALDPTGPWAMQNQANARELRNARSFGEQWLLGIIIRNDTEGRRLSSPEDKAMLFAEVAEDYDEFFRRYPDSEEAYEQAFLFSELLYFQLANEGDCAGHYIEQTACEAYLQQAGDQYRAVVEMRPDPAAEHAHDAALGALQIYDQFMTRSNPRVDDPLPPPGEFDTIMDGERLELNADAQQYVDIVQWFADLYPEDEQIPAASWRAASLYLYARQVGEAAERFETIVEHHPNHRFAQNAALGAFVCYSHEENWVKIETVARRLLENCSGDRDICNVDGLTGALAFAMNNQAVDLMAEGDTARISGDEDAANGFYLQAAEKQVALYEEFPDSEWSPAALNNAAGTFERAREIRRSIEYYNRFLTSYPAHEFEADVKFTLGLIHESQAEFAIAADWYEQVDAFESYEDRPTAVLKAARLREAMSEFERSIELYEHYISLGADQEVIKEVFFQIANLERDRGNIDAAYDRLQSFRDTYSSDVVRRVVATFQQAEMRREQGNMSEALRLYGEVTSQYGAGTMGFGEDGAPSGWTVAPGGNIADEAMRTGLIPFAAEALFWQSEPLFEAAKSSDLDYRAGRVNELVEKLVARGAAIESAEQAFYSVLNMGDAEWAVAAATRLGQLYKDFDADLYRVPPPDYDQCLDATRGNYDACDEQEEMFFEQLAFFGETLQAKALERWEVGFQVARENRIFTPFTLEMIASLNEMDRSFLVGGARDVRPVSTSDPYISTRYTLDLSEKLAAFEDFVVPVVPMDAFGNPIPQAPEGMPVEGEETMAPEGM